MWYIRYQVEVLEPLKIVDSDSSRNLDITTLHYIPGSTIRGGVVNHIVPYADFESKKKILLSEKVRFLNAYPYVNEECLIPAPMGFFENKQQDGWIKNAAAGGGFTEGDKRAALGEFGIIKDDTFEYMSVGQGDSLNINIAEKAVFCYNYISPPCVFAGFIAVEEDCCEDCKDMLLESLKGIARIGSKRSSGYGKVMITTAEEKDRPYGNYSICSRDSSIKADELYMMCLAPMAMMDEYGENCGIDLSMLAQKLGVQNVAISFCATEMIRKTGINRVWESRTPEYRMYAPGSVFKLKCSQVPEEGRLRSIEDQGIGICKNEGCGRVVFLKNFPEIVKKKELITSEKSHRKLGFQVKEEDLNRLIRLSEKGMLNSQLRISKERYLAQNIEESGVSSSQAGIIISMCNGMRYAEDSKKIRETFLDYFKHVKDKSESQKVHTADERDHKEITLAKRILENSLTELFPDLLESYCDTALKELLTEDEVMKIKLDLILSELSAINRIGKGGSQT